MSKKILAVCVLLSVMALSFTAVTETRDAWWIGTPIQEFQYVDLVNVSSDEIDAITSKYIGQPYVQSEIDALADSLMATGRFLSVEIIPSRGAGDSSQVTLFIEFLETQNLSSVTFKGNKVANVSELTKAAALELGKTFDSVTLNTSINNIQALYASKGYDKVDVVPSYATDPSTNNIKVTFTLTEYDWWLNKTIKQFQYKGLVNVPSSTIDDITYPYLGKTFTKQLYAELESELNTLLKFSLFQSEASRGGESNNDLIITFTFTELPQIESIQYIGNSGLKIKALEEVMTVKKGDFLSWSQVNSGKEALKTLYLEKGFADSGVESSYEVNKDTNKLALTYTITEGRQWKITEILFEGNEKIATGILQKKLTSKAQSLFNNGNYTAANITADIQALQLAYQTEGYIDVAISDVRLEEITAETDPLKKLRVVFVIKEGEQWLLDAIVVTGNQIYSDEQIQALLTMESGSVLDIQKVQTEIGKIADLYWNEGYVENSIDLSESRDEANHTIRYTVAITERAQAIVEAVLVRGLTKAKPYVMERELSLHAGDIFSKEKYIKSAQSLYNTGLLTDVKPNISYGTTENALIVAYDVTEGNQINVGFGATFGGNVEGFPVSGFLTWSDTNLWGTGRDLSISTELSPDTQEASITFSDNWVGDKRWSNAIEFSFEHSSNTNALILGDGSPNTDGDNEAFPWPYNSYAEWEADDFETPEDDYLMPYEYYQISLGYTTGYTFVFDPGRLSLGFGPTFTLNRAYYDTEIYTPYDYLIYQYQLQWQFSNRLNFSASWDGRDLVSNTTKGYVFTQKILYAGGIMGGLSDYIRTSTSASGYLKLFEIPGEKPTPGVISLNSTLSLIFNQFNGDFSASKYEYLYIDGMTVGRGFDAEFYKKFMWDNSLEFSIQIVENLLWGELYTSATGVQDDLDQVTSLGSLDWYFSMGAGIKLKIPGFPLGLYLVKNATWMENEAFAWQGGSIFKGSSESSGLKLVLAITTSIF